LYTEPGIEATACARELLYVYVYVMTSEVCYLGHIITDKLKDDADIVRELRKS